MNTDLPADEREEEKSLDHAAYVLASKYRQAIVNELKTQPTTPSQIADRNDLALSHVSRALTELRDKGIVHSHGDGSRTKLYTLTDHGAEVAELVGELDQGGVE